MTEIERNVLNRPYSHIYVERKAADHPRTLSILSRFPYSRVVPIDNYTEIFNRRRQDSRAQHKVPSLILALREEGFLYPGAPVCQSFGNTYYYYTSCMLNCVYDCEYCFLKGMYPCAYPVIFVNIEDFFAETDRVLAEHDAALFVSYDTDMLAAENIAGYANAWSEYAGSRAGKGLSVEIRTKSARHNMWEAFNPYENVVYAFTLSPKYVIEHFEHGTPSLRSRVKCMKEGLERGFQVRACFDPVIYCPGWKEKYGEMLEEVCSAFDLSSLKDVSVGSFRISGDYLGKLRKAEPESAVAWYPFEKSSGYYHYDTALVEEMETFLITKLEQYIEKDRIFRWDQGESK